MIFLIITYLYKPINDRKDQNGKCIELSVPLCYNDWQSKYRGKQPMDQVKIGKFIAQQRKKQGLTQLQLAEKLGITDRAVSKWETGKSMPDVSIITDLCKELGVTVNDLIIGEVVSSEQYNKKLQQQVLTLVGEKETAEKRSLRLVMVIAVLSIILALMCQVVFALATPDLPWLALAAFFVGQATILLDLLCMRLDWKVGYFQCPHCGHTYTPPLFSFLFARGGLYRRHLRCTKCKQKAWHQRVYTINDETESTPALPQAD